MDIGMIRIVAFCGSLRSDSLNRRALLAARAWTPSGCAMVLWEGLAGLPPFTPDFDRTDEPTPAPVADFRREVGAAHGLLIACPEYAHGIPGAFKNALDWLVGDTSFPGKPVALLKVAPRAQHAQAQLREVQMTMSANDRRRSLLHGCVPEAGCAGIAAGVREGAPRIAQRLCRFPASGAPMTAWASGLCRTNGIDVRYLRTISDAGPAPAHS
jgi:NAD(P)H-dependent FMN reductase